ncbi:MAG: hypothetical protein LBU06_10270 [Desulfovibrio sp.]|nr:hypothetical protein [Desulfovibrio sp.]
MANETHPDPVSAQYEDADDEIVDLLEVVKPGRNVPRSGTDDADFTADLDSMLDTLSEAENTEATGVKNLDPNPVTYRVNHNESLNLPDMDELEDILDSLAPDDRKAMIKVPALSPEITPPGEPGFPDLDALPFSEDSGKAPASDAPDRGARAETGPGKVEASGDVLLDSMLERAEADDPSLSAQDGAETDTDAMIDMEGMEGILGDAGKPAAGAADPASGRGGGTSSGREDASGSDPAAAADDWQDGEEGSELPRGGRDSSADTGAGEGAGTEPPSAADADAPQIDAAPPFGPGSREDGDFAPAAGETEDAAAGKTALDADPPVPDADFGRTAFDEVDLVELDALLDDMLAGAPASGPGPGEIPAPGSRAEQAASGGAGRPEEEISRSSGTDAEGGPPPADGEETGRAPLANGEEEIGRAPVAGGEETGRSPVAGAEEEIGGSGAAVRSLRADFEALRAGFEALEAREPGRRQDGFTNLLKAHDARLDGLDLSRDDIEKLLKTHGARLDGFDLSRDDFGKLLKAHGARLDGLDLSRDDIEKLLKSHGARLDDIELARAARADGGDELLKKLEETRADLSVLGRRLDGIEARFAGLQADLDKSAAAAAARVIREELSALLAEQG